MFKSETCEDMSLSNPISRIIQLNPIFDPEWYIYFNELMFPEERIRAEIQFIINRLELKPGANVLDLPCGYGKYSIRLAKQGFKVTGIDIQPEFIQRANQDSAHLENPPEFYVDDMRTFKLNKNFDCALMLNTSFGYFEHEENLEVIQRVSRSLNSGGFFVVELMNPSLPTFFDKNLKTTSAFDYNGNLLVEWRSYDRSKKKFHLKRVVIKDGFRRDFSIDLAHYTLAEMESILVINGLKIIDVYGGQKGREFNNDANSMVLIAQKT